MKPFVITVIGLTALVSQASAQEATAFFEQRIRPVFADNCVQCHNAKLKTAGIDFTSPEGIAEAASGTRLLKAVTYEDRIKMPPAGKLPAAAVQDLTAWIKSGVAVPGYKASVPPDSGVFSDARRNHWAYQPVHDVAVPRIRPTSWAQSPIDRFILSKLEEKGFTAPKPADRRTLIRRAKYDLLGLPPTEEEVSDFVADASPGAFAKLVDRYLDSPQYGEKWGRHWLDVARYAESCGVDENDPYTDAWRYREYVIDAFNRDLPFNTFIREQIAGDLLPAADGSPVNARGRIATGFLALGPKATVEMDKMKTLSDVVDEQIDTTSKAFLGLTVACARCHDHKFDPIATKDYYSMAAIFANTRTLDNLKGDFFTERKSKLYQAPLVDESVYEAYRLHQQKVAARNMQANALLENETWKYSSQTLFPRIPEYMVGAWRIHHGASADDIAAQQKLDPRILKEWVRYLDPRGGFLPHLQRWRQADENTVASIAREYAALFQKTASNWGLQLAQWKVAVDAAVASQTDLPKAPNIEYNSTTAFTDPSERLFADIVISARTLNDKTAKDGPFVLPAKEQEDHLSPDAKRRLAELRSESAELTKASPPKPPMANAVTEGPHVEQHIFIRGNYSNPGDVVQPAMPTILRVAASRPVTTGSGRMELADFLASPANPLTARVIVNRLWTWHFGEGLVRTPNNFGIMGDPPTHPELLDYLAKQFVAGGWSIKSMHRAMMLTSLYQSSGDISPEAAKADPANRLWSHFQRRAMTVEEMRDTWLQLSNTLELKMGGIFDQVDAENAGGRGGADRGMRGAAPRSFDVSKRRTIYVAVNRNAVATPMVLYDFVDSSTSAGNRPETIIAPQALYLINNPFVANNAKAFAARLLDNKSLSDEQRVIKAYRMAWQREPSSSETDNALDYIRKYPAGRSTDFAGWQSFCRILLSANEFHYID